MDNEQAMVNSQSEPRSTSSRARGFAAMFRSGAYDPSDAERVAAMFDQCAAELDAVQD